MSKMRMPEMSVVRFNESDVIVASTELQRITLNNFGNGHANDASVTIGSDTYGNQQSSGYRYSDASALYYNFNGNTQFKWDRNDGSGQNTFAQLLGFDTGSTSNSGVDGEYYWNGTYFQDTPYNQ